MSRRRFRIGLYPRYDQQFDRHKGASQVLTPTAYQVSWQALQMSDAHGLATLLAEVKVKLRRAENAVAKADADFQQLKAIRANTGRTIPKEREPQAQADYEDTLALLDVTGEEIDKIQGLLEKTRAKQQAVEDGKVLRYGPCGTGKVGPEGILSVLDGQTIKQNADHMLVIDDTRSPYDGMLVADYKKYLVFPWLDKHPHREHAVERASLPPWPKEVPRPE